MKKILSIIMALTMVISALSFATTAYAVEYVTVYLNEKAIDFPSTDARPHIRNNRTYVPVRKTCEALGLSIDWNSKTETMTLTRDGVTIAHTMRSKIVYVNGESVSFDTASINDKNRILMPIRMIAESIGATVTWDDPTRSVHINTTGNSNTNTNNDNTASEDVSKAVVNSVSISEAKPKNGSNITISAICSKETTAVKFIQSSDNSDIGSVSKYTENADGTRTFVTDYTCKNDTGSETVCSIQAVPAIGKTYNETLTGSKSVSFTISSSKDNSSSSDDKKDDSTNYESDNMISCKLTSKKIKTDDYAKFKIKTTTKVKKVKLTTDANDKSAVISDYDEDDDERTFSGKLQMTKEGDWEVYVTLYVSGDYESEKETFDVTVDDDYDDVDDDDDDDDDSSSGDLEIQKLWLNNNYAYKGYDTTVYVKTSTDVDHLELLTEDQDEGEGVTTRSTADKTKSYYYWEFTFTVKHTGDMRFKLLAYDDDGESVSKTFDLEGRSVSKSKPAILSVEQKTGSIVEGKDVKLNITTTGCVDRIRITKNVSGSTAYDEKVNSTSSSEKTHTVTFELKDADADYYITAYNGDDYDRMKFTFEGDFEEELEIKSVELSDKTIDIDENLTVTVTTSNSAYRVWVEDNRETQLSSIYKTPSDEDGNDLIWKIKVSPIDDGRQTLTVKAQDQKKKNDVTKDFTITVNK